MKVTQKFAIKGQNGLYLNRQRTAFNISARALGAANQHIAHFDTEEDAVFEFEKKPVLTLRGAPHKISIVKRIYKE